MTARTLADVRAQHLPSYSRRRLGAGAISGRPTYGWSVKCACGWEKRSNEHKASVEQDWRDHTRGEWKGSTAVAQASQEPSTLPVDGMAEFALWQKRQEQVKPCPCCSGRAIWRMASKRDGKLDEVECTSCGLAMKGSHEPGSALDKWNLRTATS